MPENTFDTSDLALFLQQRENLTIKKAQGMASTLMTKLTELPQLSFTCKTCGLARSVEQQKGTCRCSRHGYEHGGKWRYRYLASPWKCTVTSLINLPEATIAALGTKSQVRVRSFIAHLRRQK